MPDRKAKNNKTKDNRRNEAAEGSFRQVISMIHLIKPSYIPVNIFMNLIQSVRPFINMYLSALIIDGIIGLKPKGCLVRLALMTAGANMLLSLI